MMRMYIKYKQQGKNTEQLNSFICRNAQRICFLRYKRHPEPAFIKNFNVQNVQKRPCGSNKGIYIYIAHVQSDTLVARGIPESGSATAGRTGGEREHFVQFNIIRSQFAVLALTDVISLPTMR